MALINEYYSGYRQTRWDEQTDVTFDIRLPENPDAIPQPYVMEQHAMEQQPTFGPLDEQPVRGTRDELVKLLSEGKVLVAFFTVDGQKKKMLCTTAESAIPHHERPSSRPSATLAEVVLTPDPSTVKLGGPNAPKPDDKNLFKVYSIDRQGWRSFRFERVIEFSKYNL